jgi:uncharacterized repeat protein (TIGR01451 family)
MRRYLTLAGVVAGMLLSVFLLAGNGGGRAAVPRAAAREAVINEVGWAGTDCSPYDEWIELYNNTGAPLDLAGWTLEAIDGTPSISLQGTIPAQGYFLLERQDDDTISDIPADLIYAGALEDAGETLELRDGAATLIDTANAGGGGWPGGSNNPDFSMERVDPAAPDEDANWGTNDGVTRNGLDCNGLPINGTPRARNSVLALPAADLSVAKAAPRNVLPGELITYTLYLSNTGQLPAQATWLTDVLPAQVEYLAHTAPYPFAQPTTGTLVWDLGTVPTSTASDPITFSVTGRVDGAAFGAMSNTITATTATTEGNPMDNVATAVTLVGSGLLTPTVLVEALYFETYELYEVDEAVRLVNVSLVSADLGGWGVSDGTSLAIFPPGTTLSPGGAVWCTKEAVAFERQFGFKAGFETEDTDPEVPEMGGSWPGFANAGDECLLIDNAGVTADALVYKEGNASIGGWSGVAVQPWQAGGAFAGEGQILYRKRNQATGLPLPDTDTAADWAQDPADHLGGRRVQYPGWDLDRFFYTQRVSETAALVVAVAPDNLFEAMNTVLSGAEESIQIGAYTLQSWELTHILTERLASGVEVTVLLEGAPAVTGIADQERWMARQLHDAGADLLFMVNYDAGSVYDRYSDLHAKFIVVDRRIALIGSENLNPRAIPADDKADGTAGQRGVYLMTDAPGVVERVQAILDADADPAHHYDVVGCDHPLDLCSPPVGFEPDMTPDWTTYTVQFPAPLWVQGELAFEVLHSPENSQRTQDGLLGLIGQAGPGDTVLVEQFYEYTHWGPCEGAPETDPNPRLEACLDAARRGASVRVLLDSHFDSGGHDDCQRDNTFTLHYLQAIAREEGLDLQVRLGDPTYLGLHNKMVLAQVGGRGTIHVGSLNGSEASAKVNREVALQVQSDEAYAYLAAVFDYDWRISTPAIHLPLAIKSHEAPRPADHLLVSEVYYTTIPEKEWVEIYNPTPWAVDLFGYKIGDAVHFDDYEGMYRFPQGSRIDPQQVLVVAVTAVGFREDFPGRSPDYEIVDTDPAVPDLLGCAAWGEGDWGLANGGDEVLLLDGSNHAVDVLVYGDGSYPGVVPHPGGIVYGHSLEREPIWLDTDDCSADFRDWPYPGPGELP